MKHRKFYLIVLFALTLSTPPMVVEAQDVAPSASSSSQPGAASENEAQLEQLLAPIALYPDPLMGQVLMASTYPLEIVEASRWLQNTSNAGLSGDALAAALDPEPWDPSVKALVAVPPVLHMMDKNLQWTEQLGDAFLAQQGDVTNAIQNLRQRAQASGALASTPQETISTQGSAISIEPEDPNVVYVPVYNPMIVYGSWPYADYEPYYFSPPGYVWGAGLIGYGVGFVIASSLWGWDHWDWQNHRIDIDDRRFSALNRGQPPRAPGVWQHNPDHRHGVPYRDMATRTQFQGVASPTAERGFRGYSTAAAYPSDKTLTAYTHRNSASPISTVRTTLPPYVAPETIRSSPAYVPPERAATPMFESFSRGSDVRAQSARGATSRAMPASVNSFHGNQGGGSGTRISNDHATNISEHR